MTPMTLQEFQEQALRLHKRYPWVYPGRKQVELAWHVYGLPLEWFKVRVDYVIRSGDGRYDWERAANERRRALRTVDVAKESPVGIVLQGIRQSNADLVLEVRNVNGEISHGLVPSEEVSAWDLVKKQSAQDGEVQGE